MGKGSPVRRGRIGVDFHAFDGIFQGSRSHILGLFKCAVALAPEIDFYFFLSEPERLVREWPVFQSSNSFLVKMRSSSGLVRLGLNFPYYQKRYKLDLLHTQYRIPFFPLGPCACTIHDLLFESHPEFFPKSFVAQSKLSFRFAARKSSLLYTVSDYSRSEIVNRFKIDANRVEVLYNGVDTTRFFAGDEGVERLAEVGLRSHGYILTVGRLEPRKNHAKLIEAYAELGPDAPMLVCVGQRDFGYDAALSAAERFGVSDKVKFIENADDRLLPILMRHARLFVFVAIAEGFGMPVIEALASGVPCIASEATAIGEVAGDAALLVDPSDASSISEALRRALHDDELCEMLVQRGLERVGKFAWMASATRMVSSYRTFLAKGSAD